MDEREVGQVLAALLSGVRAFAAGEDDGLAVGFAGVQHAREVRLDEARERLTETLGADHPDVVALTDLVEAAQRYSALSSDLLERIRCAPRVRPHELVLSGEVVDRAGRPLPGLRVRLYARDDKHDDLLGDDRSDARGAFHFVFPAGDRRGPGAERPALYVSVDAPDGRRLADTREQAVPQSGSLRFLRIELTGVRADELGVGEPSGAPRQCTATTTRGQRCKRPARPGSAHCALHA